REPAEILAEMTEVARAAPHLGGKAEDRADAADAIARRLDPFEAARGWRRFHELFPQLGAIS
ncbi:MAG: beta-hexosaminidase, partial [Hyphomonas sp.]